jgi:hypothetical protein
VRPSQIACCALALWLTLSSSAPAQIGGLVPESAQEAAPTTRHASANTKPDRPPIANSDVEPASLQEEAPLELAPIPGEDPYYEAEGPILGDAFSGGMDCCGQLGCTFCGQRGSGCGPLGNGCFSGLYVRAEYLLWSTSGMDLPVLVTTSPAGTAQANAGILGLATTSVLFGGGEVSDDWRSGGRLVVGWWFDPCRRLGIEGDLFTLEDEGSGFTASSTGNPILGRPFFDVVQGIENVNLVAFPGQIQGSINAAHLASFEGAGARVMYNLACGEGGDRSWLTHCPIHTGYRMDLLLGYRALRLDDRLVVVENSVSQLTANPGAFFITDLFDTENEFHGIDFGTTVSFCRGCFSVELLSKIALGSTRNLTTIDGSTIITQNGVAQPFTGGMLAQRTNIGVFEDEEFSVVPELGVTLGYQLNPCWRATVGYSFLYWSRVARAGDQIDRHVNPNLFPPEGPPPVTTNLRPEFDLLYTDFWAQGFNFGIEGRW